MLDPNRSEPLSPPPPQRRNPPPWVLAGVLGTLLVIAIGFIAFLLLSARGAAITPTMLTQTPQMITVAVTQTPPAALPATPTSTASTSTPAPPICGVAIEKLDAAKITPLGQQRLPEIFAGPYVDARGDRAPIGVPHGFLDVTNGRILVYTEGGLTQRAIAISADRFADNVAIVPAYATSGRKVDADGNIVVGERDIADRLILVRIFGDGSAQVMWRINPLDGAVCGLLADEAVALSRVGFDNSSSHQLDIKGAKTSDGRPVALVTVESPPTVTPTSTSTSTRAAVRPNPTATPAPTGTAAVPPSGDQLACAGGRQLTPEERAKVLNIIGKGFPTYTGPLQKGEPSMPPRPDGSDVDQVVIVYGTVTDTSNGRVTIDTADGLKIFSPPSDGVLVFLNGQIGYTHVDGCEIAKGMNLAAYADTKNPAKVLVVRLGSRP